MNNKKMRIGVANVLALATGVSCLGAFAGCNKNGNKSKNDPESRPLVSSISIPDGVFNPFFSSSAYDSQVIGLTQIGMLDTDKNGTIVCGEDHPTVVKSYSTSKDDANKTMTYEFVIKNGIKFSDGEPLTIKDVLFNLYVLLDPAYTGSSTIYSTKILGLNEYRTQNPEASEGSASSFNESFNTDANNLVNDIIAYVQAFGKYSAPSGSTKPSQTDSRWDAEEEKTKFNNYIKYVADTFHEELVSDWNSVDATAYEEWGGNWTNWLYYFLNDGGFTDLLAKNPDNTYKKTDKGNYYLDDAAAEVYADELNEYLTENADPAKDNAELTKEWAISYIYDTYFDANVNVTKINANDFATIANRWNTTSTTIRDRFAAQIKSEYFANLESAVPNIEGIKAGKKTVDGVEHDTLKITIDISNGEDPKAIYNFAFNVAPMHYYSGTYEGVNYVDTFDIEANKFGVKFGDIGFMDQVVNAPEKVGLPVGAGIYKASSAKKTPAKTASEFLDSNRVYYERNEYFTTLGSGIENAKIKYYQYKVVNTDQIVSSLMTGEIDVGDPNATQENIKDLNEQGIAHKEIDTSGYGYVGINPRFVPTMAIRRAIIKAMDRDIITNDYYRGGLASIIQRPISKVSWAYPDGATVYTAQDGTSYAYDSTGSDIEAMVIAAGYTKNSNGVYHKMVAGFGDDILNYKFTIAGGSDDHPAYKMFITAAKILNRIGWDVQVVCSQTALSDLHSGKLTVWAAAWSSTIDPDMYQIYHMNSSASSTNNWGYKQIKANKTLYSAEWSIIQELSGLIDDGRTTTVQDVRKEIYSNALDLIMELAVEFPTYQRKDMTGYNAKVIDEKTLTPASELTPYNGLFSRLWEVNYK